MEMEGEVSEGLSRESCVEEMGKKLEILAKAAKGKEETAGKVEECGEWKGGRCVVQKLLNERDARLAKCVSVFDQQKKEFDRIVELNRDLLQRIDELQKE